MPTPQLITTDSAPRRERQDYWREMLSSAYVELETLPDEPRDRHSFDGQILLHPMPAIDLGEVRSRAQRIHRTPGLIARAREEFFIATLQVCGRGRIEQGGRATDLDAGDFGIFDTTRPYVVSYPGDWDVITLKIPRAFLLGRLPRAEDLTATKVPGARGVGRFITQMLQLAVQQYDSLDPASLDAISTGVLEFVVAGLRGQLRTGEDLPAGAKSYQLRKIKAYVSRHLGHSGLTIEHISQGLSLSISTIYRSFEIEGLTPADWIWSQRLAGCRRDLADPALRLVPVTKIGYRWGFRDSAHFCRTFKRAYGVTPTDFRCHVRKLGDGSAQPGSSHAKSGLLAD